MKQKTKQNNPTTQKKVINTLSTKRAQRNLTKQVTPFEKNEQNRKMLGRKRKKKFLKFMLHSRI